jgi:hypothetical protein
MHAPFGWPVVPLRGSVWQLSEELGLWLPYDVNDI